MNFYLVAIFLAACFFGIKAEFSVVLNEYANLEIANHVGLTFGGGEDVTKYAKGYANFRTKEDHAVLAYEMKEGIICFFTLGIDEGNAEDGRVIKLEENGLEITNTSIHPEKPLPNFVYTETQKRDAQKGLFKKLDALNRGTEFIKKLSKELQPRLVAGQYKYVAVAHFQFEGFVNKTSRGKFFGFTLLYSKEITA